MSSGASASVRDFSSETVATRRQREASVDLTPSIGVALGTQTAEAKYGASTFDAATPSQWALLAPGLGIAVGPFEARARIRIPRGDIRSPMIELELFGLYF